MKKMLVVLVVILLPLAAYAGQGKTRKVSKATTDRTPSTQMNENRDGELKQGEYEVISTNGAITRAFCPYTCEMRGLDTRHCFAWRSASDPKLCYVQDTRVKTNAIYWHDPYTKDVKPKSEKK